MITIIYKEYKLTQNDVVPERFDLHIIKTHKEGDDAGKEYEVLEGYAFHLETAVKRIVGKELAKKNDVVDLNTFISLHKDAYDELNTHLKAKGYNSTKRS